MGRITIEWKGWKERPAYDFEMPWGEHLFLHIDTLDEAKASVQAAWDKMVHEAAQYSLSGTIHNFADGQCTNCKEVHPTCKGISYVKGDPGTVPCSCNSDVINVKSNKQGKQYRKRPLIVEAMRLPGRNEAPSDALIVWLHDQNKMTESGRDGELLVHTLEGWVTASPGDWIIKGTQGELYPIKPGIFDEVYEPYPVRVVQSDSGDSAKK